jgi:hypothetical protein
LQRILWHSQIDADWDIAFDIVSLELLPIGGNWIDRQSSIAMPN